MAIAEDIIGTHYRYPDYFEVDREKIREFAKAVKDEHPAHYSEAAAKECGQDGRQHVAPRQPPPHPRGTRPQAHGLNLLLRVEPLRAAPKDRLGQLRKDSRRHVISWGRFADSLDPQGACGHAAAAPCRDAAPD